MLEHGERSVVLVGIPENGPSRGRQLGPLGRPEHPFDASNQVAVQSHYFVSFL